MGNSMVELKSYTSCLFNHSLNKHMLDSFVGVNCASNWDFMIN